MSVALLIGDFVSTGGASPFVETFITSILGVIATIVLFALALLWMFAIHITAFARPPGPLLAATLLIAPFLSIPYFGGYWHLASVQEIAGVSSPSIVSSSRGICYT